MKQKETREQTKQLKEQSARLNHILDRVQGKELFKKSNDIAREMLKKMRIVAKDF